MSSARGASGTWQFRRGRVRELQGKSRRDGPPGPLGGPAPIEGRVRQPARDEGPRRFPADEPALRHQIIERGNNGLPMNPQRAGESS